MAQMGRPGLSSEQKHELWRRWKDGQSLTAIGILLGKHAGSIHGVLSANGGITPRNRTRRLQALTLAEREDISRGLMAGTSMRKLAEQLGRTPSTISREVARNGGVCIYRAAASDECARERARRPKTCALAANEQLREVVGQKLQDDWSPQQISGWLKTAYQNDTSMQVSHETIYRSLLIQARGVLRKELIGHLRSKRMMRRGKSSTTACPRSQGGARGC
jgi:IS30 family transposase